MGIKLVFGLMETKTERAGNAANNQREGGLTVVHAEDGTRARVRRPEVTRRQREGRREEKPPGFTKRFSLDIAKHLSYLGVVMPDFFGKGVLQDPAEFSDGGGISARCHMSWPREGEIIDAWDRLASRSEQATAFHTSAWQGALAAPFSKARRYRLITLHDRGHLSAVIPLQLNSGGSLETPGEMISDYLDPLLGEENHQARGSAVLSLLHALPVAASRQIVFHNMRVDSPWWTTLAGLCHRTGYEMSETLSAKASRIMLPASWDDYLGGLASHDRKELRRKMRNAETREGGRLSIVEADDPRLPGELERIFAFISGRGGVKAIKSDWMYRPFFRRALPGLIKARQVKLYSLMLNDRPAAGMICFSSRRGPMMWAGGWESAMSQHSPGIVLLGMSIRHSIENGASIFDLLRGQSRYKKELGAVDMPIHRLTLRRKDARTRGARSG